MENNISKKSLILGILGQDGSFLAELLASKSHEVHGIVKVDTEQERIAWILSLVPNVKIHSVDILNKSELSDIIKSIHPDHIYNFAGFSNVFNAWENVDKVLDLNARVPQHILEIINSFDKSIRFFQASSCLKFGYDTTGFQNELTPPSPIYPYGISKLYADNMVSEFRKIFGLFCCSGILFPHESERRGNYFFTKKIAIGAVDIKNGSQQKLKLGNLSSYRDYTYAKDVVEAAYLMLNAKYPIDYVIGSGEVISMRSFAKKAFEYVGLDYMDHVASDESLYRKNDIHPLCADTSRIKHDLGWKPTKSADEIIKIMIDNLLQTTKN